jgi:hypothetical protein
MSAKYSVNGHMNIVAGQQNLGNSSRLADAGGGCIEGRMSDTCEHKLGWQLAT